MSTPLEIGLGNVRKLASYRFLCELAGGEEYVSLSHQRDNTLIAAIPFDMAKDEIYLQLMGLGVECRTFEYLPGKNTIAFDINKLHKAYCARAGEFAAIAQSLKVGAAVPPPAEPDEPVTPALEAKAMALLSEMFGPRANVREGEFQPDSEYGSILCYTVPLPDQTKPAAAENMQRITAALRAAEVPILMRDEYFPDAHPKTAPMLYISKDYMLRNLGAVEQAWQNEQDVRRPGRWAHAARRPEPIPPAFEADAPTAGEQEEGAVSPKVTSIASWREKQRTGSSGAHGL